MSDMPKPASATAKVKKLLLFPGDPLIKTLKPDYYLIVDPGSLQESFDSSIDQNPDDFAPDEDETEEEEEIGGFKAPSLSDIKLVSKTMVTDKNKNQYVEFVFNVKNSGGDTVIGVEAYGQ
jgi:hypothetical protein